MDNNAYYGAEASADTKTLGERLREYYEPHEFVTIQNIDTLALKYQFASPEDIETFILIHFLRCSDIFLKNLIHEIFVFRV